MKTKIGLIGYGKFGKVVEHFFKDDENISLSVYCPFSEENHIEKDLEKLTKNSDIIIISVPLDAFNIVTRKIKNFVKEGQTIIEVCSTSVYPKNILLENFPNGVNLIGSHPMFGPQTLKYNNNSFDGFNVVLENIKSEEGVYNTVKNYIQNKKCNLIEMSADEHDKKAAKFHFLSQLVGNSLKSLKLDSTNIDTVSYQFLFNFMQRLDPDPELLKMMFIYNPYSKKYLDDYKNNLEKISQFLLEE